jgi:hypothetical protein
LGATLHARPPPLAQVAPVTVLASPALNIGPLLLPLVPLSSPPKPTELSSPPEEDWPPSSPFRSSVLLPPHPPDAEATAAIRPTNTASKALRAHIGILRRDPSSR